MRRAMVVGACMAIATAARGAAPPPYEARDLIASLASDLAANPSATAVLEQWCADRELADPPVIVARQSPGHERPATARVRDLLHAGPDEPIRYRRVALVCGRHILSRADNWYRPGLLTDAMNTALDATDQPFGAVVRPLDFHRVTLASDVLMRPDAAKVPAEIIRNKALLETPDGTPFSLVVETYSRTILDEGSADRTRVRQRAPRDVTDRPHHRSGHRERQPRSDRPRKR